MGSKDFIGLDVGKARVGFARGSDEARLAEPLFSQPTGRALDELKKMIQANEVAALVVGLPRNLEGNETAQTTWVRKWVDQAKKEIELPFYMQDEALTTVAAEQKKMATRNQDIDALAASVILQDFLDAREAERVVW